MTDWTHVQRLALRYQSGDRGAGSQAIAELDILLRWLARQYFAHHTSTYEDWLQEARAAAAEALLDWRPGKSGVKNWVIGCVRRRLDSHVVWHLRQRRNAIPVSLDDHPEWGGDESPFAWAERLGAHEPSAEHIVVERETLDAFWRRVDALLTPLERAALRVWLWSHDGSQGSFRDVAWALGVDTKRADNLVYRIKRKLRDARATGAVGML